MVRIPGFHCSGLGSVSGRGTEIPQAAQQGPKKKKKEERYGPLDFLGSKAMERAGSESWIITNYRLAWGSGHLVNNVWNKGAMEDVSRITRQTRSPHWAGIASGQALSVLLAGFSGEAVVDAEREAH